MKRIIYHGSDHIIEKPTYGFGNFHNDYGMGFYTTDFMSLAGEWAVNSFRDGFINMYELDLNDLKILDLSKEPYSILNWIALLMFNRESNIKYGSDKEIVKFLIDKYLINVKDFDVVIGYRADDSYYTVARDFVSRRISLNQLEKALKLGKLGKQIVLVSQKSFEHIKFIKSFEATRDEYLLGKMNKEEVAKKMYFESIRNSIELDSPDVLTIMRENK